MLGYALPTAAPLTVTCALALMALTGCEQAAARPLELFVTGDTHGWITPCGCTSNQSGGLARRASYVASRAQDAETIVADVGGAPGGGSEYDRFKFAAILRGEVLMGVAAHNLGQAEAELGAAELRRLAGETGAPLLSANLCDSEGELLAEPVRIVGTARRVALVGVLSQSLGNKHLTVREPRTAVSQTLERVRGKYDVAVLLAYAPADELRELARQLPEIDLIIGGQVRQSIQPELIGPVLLAAVANKGKFLAHLTAPADRKSPWQGEIVELNEQLADDPHQLANLDRFHRELLERDFTAEQAGVSMLSAADDPDLRLAGTQACQQCHAADCSVWQDSGHAQAWGTLARGNAQGDCYCQQCHTTGYGLPGGFVSAQRSPQRVGVGCESCHGPGAAHVRSPRQKLPFMAADQCQRCHDRENSSQFAYDTYWPQIAHGQPAQISARPSSSSGATQ